MKTQRIAAFLIILAASLLLSTGSAQALCQEDSDCASQPAPYNQCVDAHCGNAFCPVAPPPSSTCIPAGGVDDVLFNTRCCSGTAVPGSTCCVYQKDWGTTWASCSQICA